MNIFKKHLSPYLISIYGLALLFIQHAAVAWLFDPKLSPDSHFFKRSADRLLSLDFNYQLFLHEAEKADVILFYLGFISLAAMVKLIAGAWWQWLMVFTNIAAVAGVSFIIMQYLRRGFRSWPPVLFCAFLFLASFDILLWTRYILGDATYMFLSFFVFFAFYKGLDLVEGIRWTWLCAGLAALAVIVFFRPVTPLVVIWAVLAVAQFFLFRKKKAERRGVYAKSIALLGVIVCLIGIVGFTYYLKNPSQWPLKTHSHIIKTLSQGKYVRMIVYDRPETSVPNPHTHWDYIVITGKRLYYFFNVYLDKFSFRHKLMNLVFYVPCFVLGLIGLVQVLFRPDCMALEHWWAVWLAIQWILGFAIFHSLLGLDYDWRYRLPVLPELVLVAAINLGVLWRRAKV